MIGLGIGCGLGVEGGLGLSRHKPAVRWLFSQMSADTFPGEIDFSRASGATEVGPDGLIRYAPENRPRFNHDVTLVNKGLLIEESRTNAFAYSDSFVDATWSSVTNSTVTANQGTCPDGSSNATKWVESTTASVSRRITQTATVVSGTTYTISIFAKAAGRVIQWHGGGTEFGNLYANFDLVNGVVGNKSASVSAQIVDYGNGWYRCIATATTIASGTGYPSQFYLIPSPTSVDSGAYTGDGVSGVYIWGAQFEVGSFATSYIPTSASTVTRSADIATVSGVNLTKWYNQSEGTIIVKGQRLAAVSSSLSTGFPRWVSLSDGSANNAIEISGTTTGGNYETANITTGGVVQTSGLIFASVAANTQTELAMTYKDNLVTFSKDGATAVTDTSATIPTVSQLNLGNRYDLNRPVNGTLSEFTYYRRAL